MNRASAIIKSNWAHEHRIYGRGVGIAIVDSGISLHPDFSEDSRNRIIAFQDFINGRINPYDDNNHGTHVAGIAGGNGRSSGGLYMGVAPQCNLIGVKVLNYKGNGNVPDVLNGLEWIIRNRRKYNIRVVNISVGTTSDKESDENSMLVKGVNEVWDAGMVVLAAAGNNGPLPKSIGAPGNSRKIITVGASDDSMPVNMFGNQTRDYSGRGPTPACIKKPDIVCPGSNIISCNAIKNYQGKNPVLPKSLNRAGIRDYYQNMYVSKSGTSMATPMVSGAIALLLSVYPDMTPKDVKMKLRESGTDLGFPQSKQGWGLLNIERLLS